MNNPLQIAISEAREELSNLEEHYAPLTTGLVMTADPDDPRLQEIDPVHMIEWVFRAEQLASLTSRESVEMPSFVFALQRAAQPLKTATEPDFALAA